MYYLLSILAGTIISVMVMINGKLSGVYGLYLATAVIHLVGFLFAFILTAVKKEAFTPPKNVPFHLYLGGVVGVVTIVFNNFAFGKISISSILAICLLGQSITSLIFDQYGFFGMPKSKFHPNKLIGLSIVVVGIVIMISYYEINAFIPIVLSLITGFTVVCSRTLSAGLAEKTSVVRSTLYGYATGFALSLVILLILGGGTSAFSQLSAKVNPLYFLGGVMGVVIIIILNASVSKISSLYMTLILFVGQVFSGIAVDMILTDAFSLPNFLGGVFVTLGLCINVIIDRRDKIKDTNSKNRQNSTL